MTIVIPCAGKAMRWGNELSRWRPEGPPPLFLAAGRPLIDWALAGMRGWLSTARYMFVSSSWPEFEAYVRGPVARRQPQARISGCFTMHRGGELETVLAGRNAIAAHEPVVIASCNVYLESNLAEVAGAMGEDVRAVVLVKEPRNREEPGFDSFRSFGDPVTAAADGRLLAIGQWEPAAKLEAMGTYYFASGGEFLEIASDIQRRDIRVDGELRIQSVIDRYLQRNWRVETVVAKEAWPLRSSADAVAFERWRGVEWKGRRSYNAQQYSPDWGVSMSWRCGKKIRDLEDPFGLPEDGLDKR